MIKRKKKLIKIYVPIISLLAITSIAFRYVYHRNTSPPNVSVVVQQPMDQATVNHVIALDKQNRHANFVFINKYPGLEAMRNRVITLPPVGDDLRIDFDKYVHKGHFGPLFIILPDNYAGPKEKFILKSFPGYKGWYGSMISERFVVYAAR